MALVAESIMKNSVEPYSKARLTRRFVILALLCFTESTQAQHLELEKEILQTTADHAERICGTVPLEGSSGNVELSGSAKMELDGLLKKMADMGIQGTATYQGSQYQGLLQKDLLTAMQDRTNCKMSVNNLLMGKLLAAAVAAREPLKLSVNILQATTGAQAPYETKFLVTVNQIYTPVRLLVQCDEEIIQAHGSILGAAASMSGGWGGRFSKNRFGIGILSPAWTPATPLVVSVKSNASSLGTCQFFPQ